MTTEFTSTEMEQLAGITARQLQWWDEKKVVEPNRNGGRRRSYSPEQAFLVLVVAELRHKRLPLQKVRPLVRALQKRLRHPGMLDSMLENHLCLVTDGRIASFTEESSLIPFLARVRRAVHVVALADSARRVQRPFYELAKKAS